MVDGNALLSLMKKRQSDRKYLDTPVEKEKVERILEAGRLSPSACNGQPWKFIVVDDPETKEKVASATESQTLRINTFARQAPLLIVIIREKSNFSSRAGDLLKKRDYSLIDIGVVAASMVYQASAEGLGSCIMGWLDDRKMKEALSIPRSKNVELVLSIGYSDATQREKSRKTAEETVSWNKY